MPSVTSPRLWVQGSVSPRPKRTFSVFRSRSISTTMPFFFTAELCSESPPPLPPAERSFDGFVHQLEMLKLAGSIEPASPKCRRNAMRDSSSPATRQLPSQAMTVAQPEDTTQRQRHRLWLRRKTKHDPSRTKTPDN